MNAIYTLTTHGGYVSIFINGKLLITDSDYLNLAQAVLMSATGDAAISARAAPALLDYCRANSQGQTSATFPLHNLLAWHQAWEIANNYDDDNDGCLNK